MKTDRQFLSRRIAVRAALVALVVAVCWILIPGEPSFEGRTLSEWLMAREGDDVRAPLDTERAIRAMGNRAVRTSLDWLAREDGWLTQEFVCLIHRQSFWEPNIRGAAYWHYGAFEVLRVLGPDARSVVPELISLTHTNTKTALRIRAISAIRTIGHEAEEAVPALLVCLDDAERQVRMEAAMALGSIGRQPDVVVPKLLACARDTYRFDVPDLLLVFLGFTNESARIVPALETHLQRSATARASASVLWRFGPAADWSLSRALTNQDAIVSRAAAAALMQAQRQRDQSLSTNSGPSRLRRALPIMRLRDRTNYDPSRLTVARSLALNLDHPNPELRHYFADLLVEFSDEAVVALPDVLRAMSSDDMYVAFRAWMVFDLMPLDEIELVSPGR